MPGDRRGFLNWFLATSVGAFVVSISYPVARYLVPPSSGQSSVASVTLKIPPAEIRPNSGQIFRFGSRPGIVLRTPTGDLRAFSAVCTHLGCTVQYRPDLEHIWCACHNGHYDLNGINIAGPPPLPLARYTVSTRGDTIVVHRSAPA